MSCDHVSFLWPRFCTCLPGISFRRLQSLEFAHREPINYGVLEHDVNQELITRYSKYRMKIGFIAGVQLLVYAIWTCLINFCTWMIVPTDGTCFIDQQLWCFAISNRWSPWHPRISGSNCHTDPPVGSNCKGYALQARDETYLVVR